MVLGVAAENLLGRFLGEFDAERQRVGGNVSLDGGGSQTLDRQIVTAFVELLEKYDEVTCGGEGKTSLSEPVIYKSLISTRSEVE